MKERILWIALGLLAAILVGNTFVNRHQDSTVQAAHDSLTVALRDGERQKSLVDFLTTRASQADARADAADSAATVISGRAARATVVYRTVRDSAPADCAPVIAAADSAISLEHARGDSLASALLNERSALADTKVASDSVRASYERLRTAATTLDKAVQPSWRQKLVPKLGFGGAAGIDPFTRRPSTTVGMTLGWTF